MEGILNKKNRFFIIIVVLGFVFASVNIYTGSVEKAMDKANILVEEVVHISDVDQGRVVFYIPQNYTESAYMGLVEQSITGYEWIAGTDVGSYMTRKPMTYGFSNIGKSNRIGNPKALPVISGIITDERIEKIIVEYRDGNKQEAKIIQNRLGKMWYVYPKSKEEYMPAIFGYSKDDEVIYTN